MLRLPSTTEVRRALPKAGLYKQLDWNAAQRERFDRDVSRLDFVNWLSPRTLPAIAEGADVKEIFVVEVALKTRDVDLKNIVMLGKSIPQRIVYLLRCDDEVMLAVYHTKLFASPWLPLDDATLPLEGLSLDAVWQSIVSTIGQFSMNQENSLTEQIQADDERAKIERRIATLERQMFAAKQPRRKRELFEQLSKLKREKI